MTVGPCGPAVADFASRDEHRSIVIHPLGCYSSWAQEFSPIEAERRALLFCAEANPDSDTSCKVVATDSLICPRSLETWIQERRKDKDALATTRSEMECEYGPVFEAKSAAGTKPLPVDKRASFATKEVMTALGLGDFDFSSSDRIVFGRSPESKRNWIVNEALYFVKRKDGTRTCVLRVSNEWDPTQHFESVFRVQLLGCFLT